MDSARKKKSNKRKPELKGNLNSSFSLVAFVIGVQTVAPPIVVINVVTWFVFWFDKQQSRLRNWRTPERELLWWLWTTGKTNRTIKKFSLSTTVFYI